MRIAKDEKFVRKLRDTIGQAVAEDVKDSKTKEVVCGKGRSCSEKQLERVKDEHLIRISLTTTACARKWNP